MFDEVAALKQIHQDYNLSRSQISKYLRATKQTLYRWEVGRSLPSPIFKERLRTFLRVFSEVVGIETTIDTIRGSSDV